MTVGHAAFLRLCEHLENAVEVHGLDARQRIESFARHLLEEPFGDAVGVRVAVGAGQTQQGAVVADAAEVDTPGVDADGVKWDMALPQFR